MSTEERDLLKEAVSATVDYQSFCDAIVSVFREGMFQVHFGQTQPGTNGIKWIARFWMDSKSFKKFKRVFEKQLEGYEKQFGEIKV